VGLRAQGLGWVLGLSLGLGGLGLGVLTVHLKGSLDEIETLVLRGDAQRLQAGLMDLLAQRRRTAQEWSQWSDMRAYVAEPSKSPFPESNLTSAAVGASNLAGLAVLSLRGDVLLQVKAPGEMRLDWAALLEPSAPMGKRLRSPQGQPGECGLAVGAGAGLLMICQMPIIDSEAKLPSAGVLITADWVTPERLQTLRQVLALRFEVNAQSQLPLEGEGLSVPGWASPARLTPGAEAHLLRWSLPDLVGAPAAVVQLDWPRELRTQTSLVMRGAQAVVLALAFCLAVVLLLLIDRRLVSRLTRLQRHLHLLREADDLSERLPVEGHDELTALAREANHLLARIDIQVQHLALLSSTDAMTGLANRRTFDSALALAVGRCRRSRQPLALAMLDVDHFKRFNDTYGHAAGDSALKVLSEGLKTVARRAGDLCARLGGEEFVLLMEGTDEPVALARAELLQHWLSVQPHGPEALLPQAMTVSIGLAILGPEEEPEALLARADAALYGAKAKGRNRVERAAPEPPA
jgi:diguanylate cyclase (GGDEF)-like protein